MPSSEPIIEAVNDIVNEEKNDEAISVGFDKQSRPSLVAMIESKKLRIFSHRIRGACLRPYNERRSFSMVKWVVVDELHLILDHVDYDVVLQ